MGRATARPDGVNISSYCLRDRTAFSAKKKLTRQESYLPSSFALGLFSGLGMEMKEYRFAFDMGESSLGWAVFELKERKPVRLVKTGV